MYIMGAYAYQKTNGRMEKRHYEDSVQRMVHMSMIAFFMNLCSITGQFYIVFKGYYFSEKYLEYVLLVILILLGVVNFVIWNGKRKIINCIIKE